VDWAQILVIILSVFLAIFLLLAIILVVMLIRVTHQIRSVASSAMQTVEHMESTVAGFSKVSSPLFIFGLAKKLFKKRKHTGRES
jgi:uncharacterized protein YoxC